MAHLRKNLYTYKISFSEKNLKKLNKLGIYPNNIMKLEKIENDNDNEDNIKSFLWIKKTTFKIIKDIDRDREKFIFFKIINCNKIGIILKSDFSEKSNFITLNHYHRILTKSNNIQEEIFMYILSKKLNIKYKSNFNINNIILYFKEHKIKEYKKMINQSLLLSYTLTNKFSKIYKNSTTLLINKIAKKLLKKEIKNNKIYLDKWNPSDIWVTNCDMNKYKKVLDSFETIQELNNWLKSNIEKNENIIGISLKMNKISDKVWLDKINVSENIFNHRYIGYIYKQSTMSIRIQYEWINTKINISGVSEIDIRNFTGGKYNKVNIELISKKGHRSGKLTSILNHLFHTTKYKYLQNIILQSKQKKIILEKINEFDLNEKIKIDFLDVLLNNVPLNYKESSKLQGLLILNIIENGNKDYIINEMINYGRSQTKISSPFYVIK